MLLNDIKTAAATYHGKTSSDLTINGLDLFLVAANNVRKNAELRHNFVYAGALATLDIDGQTGASLDDAVITDNENGLTAVMTGVDNFVLRPSGGSLNSESVYTYSQDFSSQFTGTLVRLQYSGTRWELFGFPTADVPLLLFYKSALTGTYTQNDGIGSFIVTQSQRYSGIKEVIAVSRLNTDGTRFPLDFARADLPIERDRSELEVSSDYWWDNRYLSDQQLLARRSVASSGSIIQRRNQLFVYPRVSSTTAGAANISVEMEVQCWLRDYNSNDLEDTEATDFFCEHGSQLLMWGTILELNKRFKTFVPRTEGELPPPVQEFQSAWNDFLLWDSYMVDNNTTRSR